MSDLISHLTDQLKSKGIRPSFHRLKVLAYLWKCETHPTVETIFSALAPEIPSLSKATIYNALHTFIETGLVRELDIDTDAQHYDVILEDHGHFKCQSCGNIFNFEINFDQFIIDGLQAFQIEKKDVYFSGLCPGCQ